jgi:hypothetical protein
VFSSPLPSIGVECNVPLMECGVSLVRVSDPLTQFHDSVNLQQTFPSKGPFCASGIALDLRLRLDGAAIWGINKMRILGIVALCVALAGCQTAVVSQFEFICP